MRLAVSERRLPGESTPATIRSTASTTTLTEGNAAGKSSETGTFNVIVNSDIKNRKIKLSAATTEQQS